MYNSVEQEITNLNNKFNTLEKNVKENFNILGNEMVQLSSNIENNKLKNDTNKKYIETEVDDIEKQIDKLIDITAINIQSLTSKFNICIECIYYLFYNYKLLTIIYLWIIFNKYFVINQLHN